MYNKTTDTHQKVPYCIVLSCPVITSSHLFHFHPTSPSLSSNRVESVMISFSIQFPSLSLLYILSLHVIPLPSLLLPFSLLRSISLFIPPLRSLSHSISTHPFCFICILPVVSTFFHPTSLDIHSLNILSLPTLLTDTKTLATIYSPLSQ